MNKHKVFVYGTLREGEKLHFKLESAVFLEKTTTKSKYLLLDCGSCPVMVHAVSGVNDSFPLSSVNVVGEVYAVTSEQLKSIDALEGHPTNYKREKIQLENGMAAWAYFFPRALDSSKVIKSGDWVLRNSEKYLVRTEEDGGSNGWFDSIEKARAWVLETSYCTTYMLMPKGKKDGEPLEVIYPKREAIESEIRYIESKMVSLTSEWNKFNELLKKARP